MVLGEFRAAAAGTGEVAHVAREIDRRIVRYLPDPEDFVTGVLVDIEHDGRFSVVSCGHPAPVLGSGFGRELGRFGIEEFLNRKLVRVVA